MTEFSTTADTSITANRPKPPEPQDRFGWISRPIFLGFSPPWWVGIVVLLGGAAWYQFAPVSAPKVNDLAFNDVQELQPSASPGGAANAAPAAPGFSVSQPQQPDLAEVVLGIRDYAHANREAIEQLALGVKTQAHQTAVLQEQLKEYQALITVLSARLTSLEAKPSVLPKTHVKSAAPVASTSPLKDMRLSAIQAGMAWVYWQDTTRAVQVGDTIGAVTITAIDADARQVHTSAGTIK